MPKIGYNSIYFWSRKEAAQHNTERHQTFAEELYPLAKLSGKESQEKLEAFKDKNFDLINNKEGLKNG